MHELVQQKEKNEQGNRWKHELNNQQKPTRSPSKNQTKRQHLNDERAWIIGEEQCTVKKEHGHIHLQEQDLGEKT